MSLESVYHRNLEHRSHRAGWLRAAVLGANDGLVSIASLMIGVSAAKADGFLLTAGVAGIAAGAMSMAVGEYVSVRSQNDIENSDRLLEIEHLKVDPESELLELAQIYEERGLTPALAHQVAQAMHANDALGAHLRDELGQIPNTKARPVQAAIASAGSFTLGGFIPLLGALMPNTTLSAKAWWVVAFTLFGLLLTGAASARASNTRLFRPMVRVLIGGSLGMLITAGIGHFIHLSGR